MTQKLTNEENDMRNILKASIEGDTEISFKFSSAKEFFRQMDKYGVCADKDRHSISFQYIQGKDMQLFDSTKVNVDTLAIWIEAVENLDELEKAKLFYLMTICGHYFDRALWDIDNAIVYEGDFLRGATQLFDERFLHEIPEHLQCYVDYEQFAHTLRRAGDMREFVFNNRKYTAVC